MASKLQANSGSSQFCDCGAELALTTRVGRRHPRASRGAKQRRGHSRPGQAHHEHALVPKFDRRRHFESRSYYLNFKVVSENSANTKATIHKRTITFESNHTNNSTWIYFGVM